MKKIILLLILAICSISSYAAVTENGKKPLFGSTFTPPKTFKEFSSQVSVYLNIGTIITINTESQIKSAPSPVSFTTAIGAIWPNNAFVSVQPRLAFFGGYHLWDGENALPAEVENRTTLTLSMIFDIPAAFTFRYAHSSLEAGAGIALLARYGLLAPGVKPSDSGATGTAQGDVEKINNWFWKNCNFLYPEIFAAWQYHVSERLKAGIELRYYLPAGSLIGGRGLDASMIMVASRFIF